ncbi:MAG: class I SAM-dependent methyltransferase [Pseudanabaena sp. ELA607]|jgi:2-polyprenyl-3-methyl-5-hydroxy-6-metoxy-1,4-benzoquinol methylase
MVSLSYLDAIPTIFIGVDHKAYTPEGIEQAQATFNEEGLYRAITSFAQEWYKKTNRIPRVLDLCSSTGLCAWRVAQVIPVKEVVLVDIDCRYLQVGVSHFEDVCPVSTFCEDAVNFNKGGAYDLILMNSAYHHIKDKEKVSFMKNAVNLLANDGKILVGDNFLPLYQNKNEFHQSVVIFYINLLQELEKRCEQNEAIEVIRKAAFNCWQGIDEYKVSFSIFQDHIRQSDLSIEQINHVWIGEVDQSNNQSFWGSFAVSINPNK